jgi:hypothetical protein
VQHFPCTRKRQFCRHNCDSKALTPPPTPPPPPHPPTHTHAAQVLPLSIYGSVAMAHLPENRVAASGSLVSGDQWFIYKFDKAQAGLSGLSFDEGEFGVFGYVTEGRELLSKVGTGDIIVSARVIAGKDKLVMPAGAAGASEVGAPASFPDLQ